MISTSIVSILLVRFTFAVFCPAKEECGAIANEFERWDCVNRHVFRPEPAIAAKNEHFVEYNCGGVGWGNSIRAYYTGVSLAATTGRRLLIQVTNSIEFTLTTNSSMDQYPAFNRNWLPPNDSATSWSYGMDYNWGDIEVFDFAQHGQNPGRFAKWSKLIAQNGTKGLYHKRILNTGICGGEGEFLSTGGCMDVLLSNFVKCAREDQVSMNIPFYYYLFRRPGPFIEGSLGNIRKRLELPAAAPEEASLGLRTTGYYILALHFRRIPPGFEPMAIDLNKGQQLSTRLAALEGFWDHAKKSAIRAIEIAACRQQELLIYFASDDVELRGTAEKLLSPIGRVVFGLKPDEVGHVSPSWMDKHFDSKAIEDEIDAAEVDADADHLLEKMKHSRDKNTYLGDMYSHTRHFTSLCFASLRFPRRSMVEWWILAHSHWLISSGFTSYSTSAGGVGFGPSGVMERLDNVYNKGHASTILRRDFSKTDCPVLGAQNRRHAKKCPNIKDDKGEL